uniref:Uncharacterized protein n=1 Tax=Myoviridae sp. ctyWv1 TaxID=2826718 RepID=A0A8S5QWG5_9CAUD|nr:MAG TPA: hypothetical protein [Myoviridae sp. ctyWv1]
MVGKFQFTGGIFLKNISKTIDFKVGYAIVRSTKNITPKEVQRYDEIRVYRENRV